MKSANHEKIVDRAMARIENETMVGVEGDHFTVCDFTMKGGQPGPLEDLIHILLRNAVTRVKERTQSCMAILTVEPQYTAILRCYFLLTIFGR